jgi:histidinol-phosphate aminotransferase
MRYFRKKIESMLGYIPGEQMPGVRVVKLNTNENPYPPSPTVTAMLRNIDSECLRRYPDPFSGRVRRAVSRVFGVPEDWVIVGNGSDEILSILLRACCEPRRAAAYAMPTYVLYRTLAEIQGARYIEVPYDEDYRLPVEGLIAARGALTIVCSPNSPSGTPVSREDLERLSASVAGLLVVDEAYVDFAEENALELVKSNKNVIILRTLSKGYSLAGLRLGFGIAQTPIIENLMKVKDSYNVTALSCLLGAAAIEDQTYKKETAERVKASRRNLSAALENLGFRVWPSQANFVLTRPPMGDAERIYLALKAKGILVRYFKQPRLEDKLRITVGTEEENSTLIQALTRLTAFG